MNLLIDTLPNSLNVDGTEYSIRTDFRDCLRVLMACEDNELTPQEKMMVILTEVYEETPHNPSLALEKANWFLNGGKEDVENDGIRLVSWDKDANFIYSAFRQTHGVDLSGAKLHWWQFLALFMDLGQDTTFCQLTALRSRVKRGKATKEEREAALDMGDAFEVEDVDTRSLEQKEADALFEKLIGAR